MRKENALVSCSLLRCLTCSNNSMSLCSMKKSKYALRGRKSRLLPNWDTELMCTYRISIKPSEASLRAETKQICPIPSFSAQEQKDVDFKCSSCFPSSFLSSDTAEDSEPGETCKRYISEKCTFFAIFRLTHVVGSEWLQEIRQWLLLATSQGSNQRPWARL